MFARVFALLPLALLVSASPYLRVRDDQCNTGGGAQCCNSTVSQSDDGSQSLIAALSGLINVAADADALIGVSCTPIIGNGADCSEEPVCCEDNSFNGLINLGCSPINLNL